MSGKVKQVVLRLKDEFSKPLADAKKSVAKFTKGTEKEQEQFAKIVKKTENKVLKDIKRIKQGFKNLSTSISKSLASISFKGLQKGMDMLKKFSFLGGTLGAASLCAGIFEGMDYETYKVQLLTATKDTQKASKLMKEAISFANKTPFETGQIIEATAKFESMGLSAQKWLSITADMAGATSKDMIQAVEAVIDAVASGEFERLKEFGLSKKTLEDLDTSGQVFNNKGQVINQVALTELLFSEMEKRYKGGAESLSKTTKGMWSTVTGVFKNSMAKIVGVTDDGMVRTSSLLDRFRNSIEKVANKMIEWQQDGTIDKISLKFDGFLDKCKEVFEFLKSKIDEIKKKFQEWQQDGTIDNLKEKISNIFIGVIELVPKVINFVGGFLKKLEEGLPIILGIVAGVKTWKIVSNAAAIATDLLAKKQAILNTAAKIFNKAAWSNPWVRVIGIIVAAITFLILNWDKVKEKCLAFWETLKTIGAAIKEAFTNAGAAIKEAFSNAWVSIKEMVGNIFAVFSEKFPLIANTFENIFGGIKSIFTGIIDFFKNVFTGNWKGALESLKQIAKGVFNVIKGIFLAPFRHFATGINWVIDKVNGIKVDVPEWVPLVGGKTFGFNIPKIPDFATGTSYHRGGLARINEGGRGEIVNLPNGSSVIPHNKTNKILEKNNSPINITLNVYNPKNADEIIDELMRRLKVCLANA